MEFPRRGTAGYQLLRRTYLIRCGQWEAFKRKRSELRAQGIAKRKVNDLLEAEFLPAGALEAEWKEQQQLAQSAAESRGGDSPPVNPALPPTDSPVPPSQRTASPPDETIDATRFQTKDLSWPEIQAWVAKHIEVKNVEPEDAPNAEAWGVLVWARKYKKEFWLGYGKLKSESNDEGIEAALGSLERLIGQLLEINDAAVVEAADAQKTEGSE